MSDTDTPETDLESYSSEDFTRPETVVKIGFARKLERQRNEARKQRDVAIKHLAEWCVAIDTKGGGWDEWDTYYKDAFYRTDELPEIRALLTEAIEKAKGDTQ